MSVGTEGFFDGSRYVNVDHYLPDRGGCPSAMPLLSAQTRNAQQVRLKSGIGLSQSNCEWRPESALSELAMLLKPTREMLNKLETSILSADLKSLAKLIEGVNPQLETNLIERSIFSHAFMVFQLEMTSLGFDALYDTETGVLSLDNQLPVADSPYIHRLVVDPIRKHLIVSKRYSGTVDNDTLTYNIDTGESKARCAQFGPPFRQYTSELSADEVADKYADILKSQLTSRIKIVEQEKLVRVAAPIQGQLQRLAAERKRRREEIEQQEE